MQQKLLICDRCHHAGETRVAVDRIRTTTLHHGTAQHDVCAEHFMPWAPLLTPSTVSTNGNAYQPVATASFG